jgi:outer membrane protein assembly factor BamB
VIYFSTGHPADGYNAALRPGPDLFTDSIVALNSTKGNMLWYYQFTSHDITEHEGGWSVTLANITVGGQQRHVIIQAAKNNDIYVVDAAAGTLVYPPIAVGAKPVNNINDGLTSTANLTVSQAAFGNNHEICPGPDGGIEMGPAIANNTLYVVSQNACGLMYAGPYPYKGQTISGFIYADDPAASQNSTLYAINLSNGAPIWHDNMPNRYQGASGVVSGGVVYVIDRGGVLYEYKQQGGALINSFNLGGLGAAGVSLGVSLGGQTEVFASAGGGDLPNPTPGLLAAYVLPQCTSNCGSQSSTSTGPGGPTFGASLEQPIIIALGAAVVVLTLFLLLKRRKPTQAPSSVQQAPAP